MNKTNDRPSKKAVAKRNSTSVKQKVVRKDDMLDDYSFLDWSKAERGKYAKRYAEGTNLVLIEPDLMDVFPNANSVNRALRALAEVIRASSAEKRQTG